MTKKTSNRFSPEVRHRAVRMGASNARGSLQHWGSIQPALTALGVVAHHHVPQRLPLPPDQHGPHQSGSILPKRWRSPKPATPGSHDTFSRVFRLLDPMQFQACFLRFHGGLRRGRAGGHRDRWENPRPGGDGGEVERDHRGAKTAGDDLPQGRDRDRRRAQLPARHRRAGNRPGWRLRAGSEGKSGHVA